MTEGGRRRWEDLNVDLLVAIFERLGVEDLVSGVPLTCSSWYEASKDPRCWRRLEFDDWDAISRRLGCHREAPIDFVEILEFAINRSDGCVDAVFFPDFADELDLLHVAQRCPGLHYFSFENGDVPIDKFCEAIGKLEFLEGMAVNETLICREVLEHIRRSCVYFHKLKVFTEDAVDEDMALVICEGLPHLRKLELRDCNISRNAIPTFLDKLRDLEHLDISGYNVAGITGVVLEKASRLKVFLWDSKLDAGKFDYCSGCDEDMLFQDPCMCMLDGEKS